MTAFVIPTNSTCLVLPSVAFDYAEATSFVVQRLGMVWELTWSKHDAYIFTSCCTNF